MKKSVSIIAVFCFVSIALLGGCSNPKADLTAQLQGIVTSASEKQTSDELLAVYNDLAALADTYTAVSDVYETSLASVKALLISAYDKAIADVAAQADSLTADDRQGCFDAIEKLTALKAKIQGEFSEYGSFDVIEGKVTQLSGVLDTLNKDYYQAKIDEGSKGLSSLAETDDSETLTASKTDYENAKTALNKIAEEMDKDTLLSESTVSELKTKVADLVKQADGKITDADNRILEVARLEEERIKEEEATAQKGKGTPKEKVVTQATDTAKATETKPTAVVAQTQKDTQIKAGAKEIYKGPYVDWTNHIKPTADMTYKGKPLINAQGLKLYVGEPNNVDTFFPEFAGNLEFDEWAWGDNDLPHAIYSGYDLPGYYKTFKIDTYSDLLAYGFTDEQILENHHNGKDGDFRHKVTLDSNGYIIKEWYALDYNGFYKEYY